MKLVNLGCGDRFHKDWINLDVAPVTPEVIRHDLLGGLPFEDSSINAVYASHVLEHLSKNNAERLVQEIYRVLVPNGIVRIVVPDLEQLAREYVAALDKLRNENNILNEENHKWTIIELLDQMVREESGGEMGKYWEQKKLVNEDYLKQRCGQTFLTYRADFLKNRFVTVSKPAGNFGFRGTWPFKLLRRVLGVYLKEEELRSVKFRRAGELHRWMYDELSLKRMLERVKFTSARRMDAFNSAIPGWKKYKSLDVQGDFIRKPDSLFVEALK